MGIAKSIDDLRDALADQLRRGGPRPSTDAPGHPGGEEGWPGGLPRKWDAPGFVPPPQACTPPEDMENPARYKCVAADCEDPWGGQTRTDRPHTKTPPKRYRAKKFGLPGWLCLKCYTTLRRRRDRRKVRLKEGRPMVSPAHGHTRDMLP